MKSRVLALAMVLLLTRVAYSYTSEEGRYTVTFPPTATRPVVMHQNLSSMAGPVKAYMCMAADHGTYYYIGYADYPSDVFKRIPDKTPLLEMAAESVATQVHGRVLSKTSFEYRGEKGLSVSFSGNISNTNVYGQMNLMLLDKRLYLIYAISEKRERLLDEATRTFFSSFGTLD